MEYATILKVIQTFYDSAKTDVMIGYHFRFIEDFDQHIPRIADFWNLQLNGNMRDRSQLPYDLIAVHRPLKIKKGELARWVLLFNQNLIGYSDISEQHKKLWLKKVELLRSKIEKALIPPASP